MDMTHIMDMDYVMDSDVDGCLKSIKSEISDYVRKLSDKLHISTKCASLLVTVRCKSWWTEKIENQIIELDAIKSLNDESVHKILNKYTNIRVYQMIHVPHIENTEIVLSTKTNNNIIIPDTIRLLRTFDSHEQIKTLDDLYNCVPDDDTNTVPDIKTGKRYQVACSLWLVYKNSKSSYTIYKYVAYDAVDLFSFMKKYTYQKCKLTQFLYQLDDHYTAHGNDTTVIMSEYNPQNQKFTYFSRCMC